MERGFSQKTIVRAAVISEGALLALSLLWSWARSLEHAISFDWPAIYLGLRATGPLIAFNFGIFGILANTGSKYAVYREFRDKIVYPICRNLTVGGALILAICSGFAEELLFRGVMQREAVSIMPVLLASILTSLIFAYVHFIGIFRRFFAVFLVYVLFGLYFAYLIEWTGNLAVPMVAHGLYNFIAIIMIKYFSSVGTLTNQGSQ